MENTVDSTASGSEQLAPLVRKHRGILGELWGFMRVRKRYWLAPILVALVLLGLLIAAGTALGPASPFIYAM
jgi:hypothetical protein